jgi:anti-sigma regulatory factor (Ser/Thr protein kinase)
MDPMRHAELVTIDDITQVAAARRAASLACQRLDLTTVHAGKAELITVELANNLWQHARPEKSKFEALSAAKRPRSGRMFFSSNVEGSSVQILALDQGPGMASVDRCMEDGFTTQATPGNGLGAVKRLSSHMDIISALDAGTVVSVTVGGTQNGVVVPSNVAVLSTPAPGEKVSGDDWAIVRGPRRDVYMIVDGLGHGLLACEAATLARQIFLDALQANSLIPLKQLIEQIHLPMRATRGAAIAIVELIPADLTVVCCGIGNVSCSLHFQDGRTYGMVSHNGTLGHQMPRVQEFSQRYEPDALLIMHSDGLNTHWKLASYGNLSQRSASVIAGAVYRDALRGPDDATILVRRL